MLGMGACNVVFWAQYLASALLFNDLAAVDGTMVNLAGDPRYINESPAYPSFYESSHCLH